MTLFPTQWTSLFAGHYSYLDKVHNFGDGGEGDKEG